MAWPPNVDRGAAPPLAATPDRPKGTNRCRARRCGRDKWKALGAAARHRSLRDTSREASGWRSGGGSHVREARCDRPGLADRSRETNARRHDEHTDAASDATLGNEEILAAARAKMSIASRDVAAKCRAGRRVQRHHARLAEPALSDRQPPLVKVDVLTLKSDRLRQEEACHRDQPEQIMVGPAFTGGRTSAAASKASISTSL